VVTRVRYTPHDRASSKRWLAEWTPSVTSKSPDVGTTFEEVFDHIVVANGSYFEALYSVHRQIVDWKGKFCTRGGTERRKRLLGRPVHLLIFLRQKLKRNRPLWWWALDPRVSSLFRLYCRFSWQCRCGSRARTWHDVCRTIAPGATPSLPFSQKQGSL
jgi:hypothetical protein